MFAHGTSNTGVAMCKKSRRGAKNSGCSRSSQRYQESRGGAAMCRGRLLACDEKKGGLGNRNGSSERNPGGREAEECDSKLRKN